MAFSPVKPCEEASLIQSAVIKWKDAATFSAIVYADSSSPPPPPPVPSEDGEGGASKGRGRARGRKRGRGRGRGRGRARGISPSAGGISKRQASDRAAAANLLSKIQSQSLPPTKHEENGLSKDVVRMRDTEGRVTFCYGDGGALAEVIIEASVEEIVSVCEGRTVVDTEMMNF
jgi:hypothetical protein